MFFCEVMHVRQRERGEKMRKKREKWGKTGFLDFKGF